MSANDWLVLASLATDEAKKYALDSEPEQYCSALAKKCQARAKALMEGRVVP